MYPDNIVKYGCENRRACISRRAYIHICNPHTPTPDKFRDQLALKNFFHHLDHSHQTLHGEENFSRSKGHLFCEGLDVVSFKARYISGQRNSDEM